MKRSKDGLEHNETASTSFSSLHSIDTHMIARRLLQLQRFATVPVGNRTVCAAFSSSFLSRFNNSDDLLTLQIFRRSCICALTGSSLVSTEKKNKPDTRIRWKDIYNLIDLPQNRHLPFLKRMASAKDQVMKLGGKRVIIFYFSS